MGKFKVGDRVNWTLFRGEFDGAIVEAIQEQTGYGWPVTIRARSGHMTYAAFSELEPAPKFAGGDKVRVVNNGSDRMDHTGQYGEVVEVGSELTVRLDGYGSELFFKASELAVASNNTTYASCAAAEVDNLADEYGGRKAKFKVGDRIVVRERIGRDWSSCRFRDGDEATVANSDGRWVQLDGDSHMEYEVANIEHVAAAPATATLRIAAGKFYKTRDGRKVGPMERHNLHSNDNFPWADNECFVTYADDGHHLSWGEQDDADLIAEWQDAPVVAEATTAESEITIADIVRRLEKLEAGPAIKVGDTVMLSVPARVTGIDKRNANIVTGGGSFVLPVSDLRAA